MSQSAEKVYEAPSRYDSSLVQWVKAQWFKRQRLRVSALSFSNKCNLCEGKLGVALVSLQGLRDLT